MPDFSNAGAQKDFSVIPDGTIVVVQMNVREGHVGEDGLLKRSSSGQCEGIDAEFIVVEGEYTKRKFWSFMVVSGTTDGHQEAADISGRKLLAIINSAKGLKPTDVSETAKKAQDVPYSFFDGVRFMCKVGIEPAKGEFRAKNTLGLVITPDHKEWHQVEQQPKSAEAKKQDGAVVPIAKPKWAQ
jgi:hypothetical protein